jgi:ABC-type cobalamin/Fe3+-siderophores transport system ATPase subunit
MINKIDLKFGSTPESEALEFNPETITIFVGPNNSGKSLALREIENYSKSGPQANRNIIDSINYEFPDQNEIATLIKKKSQKPPENYSLSEGEYFVPDYDPINERSQNLRVNLEHLKNFASKSSPNKYLFENFVSLFVIRLDGKTRFNLTNNRSSGDLQGEPKNHLMALFKNDEDRKKIRDYTAEAFDLYFTIDPTSMQQLRIGMSKRPPVDNEEEQSLSERARKFHKSSTQISELSDGIKAFTGLISVSLSSDYKIILIDEPEAFLHPPLAKKLGNIITSLASKRGGNVFAATHSANFLMGCVQSGKDVNIVRLTYKNEKPTARILKSDQLEILLRDPLLRSSGVLSSLFHDSAVVTEADTDRAFYEEINERLLSFEEAGISDSIFLNAQNKQTVCRIIEPLRNMGIPAVAIVDLDIFKDKGAFKKLLKSAKVPQNLINTWGSLRGQIKRAYKDADSDPKKDGLGKLSSSEKESAQNLINNLKEYGVFLVPVGELEMWLKDLDISGKGPYWLIKIFEEMGSDPGCSNYVKPSDTDVWFFLREIASWVDNPDRKGV